MEIVYQLEGAGWADARIRDGQHYRDMAVSYLSNALGDMAAAAVAFVRGARSARFAFEDEPGEHRWLLDRGADDSLRIRVLWFDDTFPARPDETGAEVFTCECTVLDFAGQVLSVLAGILEDHGVDGYREQWRQHDFPMQSFETLRVALTAPSRTTA